MVLIFLFLDIFAFFIYLFFFIGMKFFIIIETTASSVSAFSLITKVITTRKRFNESKGSKENAQMWCWSVG